MEGLLLCFIASFSLQAAFLTLSSLALLHLRKSSRGLGTPTALAAVHSKAANAFVGAGFKYEELFPPSQKPEAQRPETVKPETAAKPEESAQKPAVEIVEERGLRREVEKPTAKPEAVKPEVGPQSC
jgi:outer membrane biosynthesis protein TonB